jgi:hypothetical protein
LTTLSDVIHIISIGVVAPKVAKDPRQVEWGRIADVFTQKLRKVVFTQARKHYMLLLSSEMAI